MQTIFRTKTTTKDFTIIRNDMARDKRLSFKARGILVMILTNVEDWVVNTGWLEAQGTDGPDAIKSGLDELRVLGYASYSRQHDSSGRWAANCWTF